MTKKRGREDLSEILASPPVSLPKRSKAAAKPVPEILSETQTSSNGDIIKSADSTSEDGDEEEVDYTSSSGTSSPSSSDAGQSDEETGESLEADTKHDHEEDAITYVPGRPKPNIQRINSLKNSGLMSRISSFLPQLQAANVELEQKIAGGSTKDMIMDDANDDDEQYIEMVSLS